MSVRTRYPLPRSAAKRALSVSSVVAIPCLLCRLPHPKKEGQETVVVLLGVAGPTRRGEVQPMAAPAPTDRVDVVHLVGSAAAVDTGVLQDQRHVLAALGV